MYMNHNSNPITYVAYVRKSTNDKKNQHRSIPRQIEWCQKEAQKRGISIVKFFEDKQTGHKIGRQGFQEMIDFIYESKNPVGIITWRLSRLARNGQDEGAIKYALQIGKVQHLIVEGREYDGASSHILLGVEFGQATDYSIKLSEASKSGLKDKASRGLAPYQAPLGYVNEIHGVKGEKKILKDLERFEIVKKLFQTYLKGIYSVPQVVKKFNNEWLGTTKRGGKLGDTSARKMLSNPFYTGHFKWKGKVIKGTHEAMISWDEHEAIKKLLGRVKGRIQAPKKYESTYAGFLRCGHCGSTISTYQKIKKLKDGSNKTYEYLKCNKKKADSCPQKNVSKVIIDTQIVFQLNNIYIPESYQEWLFDVIEKEAFENKNLMAQKLGLLTKELKLVQQKIENAIEHLLVGGSRSMRVEKILESLEQKEKHIQKQIKSYMTESREWITNLRDTIDFASLIRNQYSSGTVEHKRLILRTIGSNFILKGTSAVIELSAPFEAILNCKKAIPSGKKWIELRKRTDIKEKQQKDSLITQWGPLILELRTAFSNLNEAHKMILNMKWK